MAQSGTRQVRVSLSDLAGLDRHVLAPLTQAGFTYVDQIQYMPVPELARVVPGKVSLRKLCLALGREADYLFFTGQALIPVVVNGKTVGQVRLSDLRQIVPLKGTAVALGFRSPPALRAALESGKLAWEDVARYKYLKDGSLTPLSEETADEEAEAAEVAAQNSQVVQAAIDSIVKEYEQDYDTSQWLSQDREMVRLLASLTVSVRGALEHLNTMSLGQRTSNVGKSLSDQVNSGLSQMERLKDALGVSLKSRMQRQETSEGYAVVADFARDAKTLLRERGTVAQCCGHRLAVAVIHFPKHLLTARVLLTCPVCGREVVWELVTPTMLQTYVEAGDFVPADAPLGVFGKS